MINWNEAELDKTDQQTQKHLNMHRALPPCFCQQALDTKSSRRQRAAECQMIVEPERSNLYDYVASNNKTLLKGATEKLQLRTKTDGKIKNKRMKDRQHEK